MTEFLPLALMLSGELSKTSQKKLVGLLKPEINKLAYNLSENGIAILARALESVSSLVVSLPIRHSEGDELLIGMIARTDPRNDSGGDVEKRRSFLTPHYLLTTTPPNPHPPHRLLPRPSRHHPTHPIPSAPPILLENRRGSNGELLERSFR